MCHFAGATEILIFLNCVYVHFSLEIPEQQTVQLWTASTLRAWLMISNSRSETLSPPHRVPPRALASQKTVLPSSGVVDRVFQYRFQGRLIPMWVPALFKHPQFQLMTISRPKAPCPHVGIKPQTPTLSLYPDLTPPRQLPRPKLEFSCLITNFVFVSGL